MKRKNAKEEDYNTTTKKLKASLSSLIKSARDIMRKDAG
jgi:hypothetical protein